MATSMLNYSTEVDSDIFSLQSSSTDYRNLTWPNFSCVLVGINETVPDETTLRAIGNLCTAQQILYDVFVPISLALGIPGNMAILMTVLTMPVSSTVVYILLMTVGDLTVLLIKSTAYTMERVTEDGILAYEMYERIRNWVINLFYFTGLYPNWILVFIGFERLCTVRIPLLKNRIFTIWSTKLSGAILLFGVVIVYVTVTMTTSVMHRSWVVIFSCFHTYVPLTCILITTVLTIRTLAQHRQKRLKMTSPTRTTSSQANRTEQSLTVMMIAAAISFICLTTPISVLLFFGDWLIQNSPLMQAADAMSWNLSICLFNLTHSANCYLYFLVSGNFRTHFLNLVLCRKRKRETSTLTT